MKIKYFFISVILTFAFFSCATSRPSPHQYDFTLKNTLSIFLLQNNDSYFFCIPVQYIGDYHIGGFEFTGGFIQIGEYKILLDRNDLNISVYLNESTDEAGNSNGAFNLIYLEENGVVQISKMSEPLAARHELDDMMNNYSVFIERYLRNKEYEKIINEFEKGNINSMMRVEYNLVIDNEPQNGNAMLDFFEIDDGLAADPQWFPANLDFFASSYLYR